MRLPYSVPEMAFQLNETPLSGPETASQPSETLISDPKTAFQPGERRSRTLKHTFSRVKAQGWSDNGLSAE